MIDDLSSYFIMLPHGNIRIFKYVVKNSLQLLVLMPMARKYWKKNWSVWWEIVNDCCKVFKEKRVDSAILKKRLKKHDMTSVLYNYSYVISVVGSYSKQDLLVICWKLLIFVLGSIEENQSIWREMVNDDCKVVDSAILKRILESKI